MQGTATIHYPDDQKSGVQELNRFTPPLYPPETMLEWLQSAVGGPVEIVHGD